MNPIVNLNSDQNDLFDTMSFNLSNVNVSFANAIRRTILSDIPLLVFKTAPHAESKCNMITNTTRLNNEILKQRLSCIPIHMSNETINFDNFDKYILEVNVENTTNTKQIVTTKDFNIRTKEDNKLVSKDFSNEVFPANSQTGNYIDFARLRPKMGDDLVGDQLQLVSEFVVSSAKENGMYNVVSNCSYGFDVDTVKQEEALNIKQQEWESKGKTTEEIDFETKNWKILDGKRIIKKDSYNFKVQTVGIYSNIQIIRASCDILNKKLDAINTLIVEQKLTIEPFVSPMKNAFDIILQGEDYTIGKVLEFAFYSKYYDGSDIATFCGFQKKHPHDDYSILRVAYSNPIEISSIHGHLQDCISRSQLVFKKIKDYFGENKNED